MFVSPYSVLMALLWFTAAALAGSYMLRRAEKHGLVLISAIFLLALLRGILPLDFYKSLVIRSQILYPMVLDIVSFPLYGGVTVGQGLLALWAGGTVYRLSRLLLKLVRQAKYLHKTADQVSSRAFAILFREVCEELGYRGKLKVSIVPEASSAYQAGFLQPHIILPMEIYVLEDQDICNMLRHELCHYLGRDLWVKAGMQIAACFLWWNPVMPLLNRSVEQLLELHCDRRACRRLSEEGQLEYLNTLLHVMRIAPAGTADMTLSYLGNVEEAGIQQRFLLLLHAKLSERSRAKLWTGCAFCMVLFVMSYLVILQPTDEGLSIVTTTPETSYVLQKRDGTLELYHEGALCGVLSEESLKDEPFCGLPIINERINKS